jgi:tetratricopeptide (TPR) repeat protein
VHGVAYVHRFQSKEAIADYTQAIRLDPRYAGAYLSLGDLYYEGFLYAKAIDAYGEAIRIDSNFASAYLGRGNAYSESGSFDKAILDYNEAINIDAKSVNAYGDRGLAYYKHGDFGEAINDYNKVIGLEPNAMISTSGAGTLIVAMVIPKRRLLITLRRYALSQIFPSLTNNVGQPSSAPAIPQRQMRTSRRQND